MRQKGGSVASDAVTQLVNNDTYSDMNKNFSNEIQCGGKSKTKKCKKVGGNQQCNKNEVRECNKKGGNQQCNKKVGNQQSNKKGGKQCKQQNDNCPFCGGNVKKQEGGNLLNIFKSVQNALAPKMSNFVDGAANTLQSMPAPVFDQAALKEAFNSVEKPTLPKLSKQNVGTSKLLDSDAAPGYATYPDTMHGGKKKKSAKKTAKRKVKKGGNLSALLNDKEEYSLKNKIGGSVDGIDRVGLKFDTTIKNTDLPLGQDFNRSIANNEANTISMATEPIPVSALLSKKLHFGIPAQSTMDTSTNYAYTTNSINGGSKKRKSKKQR